MTEKSLVPMAAPATQAALHEAAALIDLWKPWSGQPLPAAPDADALIVFGGEQAATLKAIPGAEILDVTDDTAALEIPPPEGNVIDIRTRRPA